MFVRKIALTAALGMSATLLVAGPNAAPASAEVAAPAAVTLTADVSSSLTVSKATAKLPTAAQKAKAVAAKRAKAVKNAAMSRVKNGQYVRGRSGPTKFDCSGLMLYAYRQVNRSLPHSSAALSKLGKRVAKKDLKVGDLVFYFSPIHHVAMYVGDGKIVHARNPSDDLEVSKLKSYPGYRWAMRILKNR